MRQKKLWPMEIIMYTSSRSTHTKLAAAISLVLASYSVCAQESASSKPKLEEIIVTAQKRVENLQDVPLSVAAVSGDKLEKAGIENLEDLTAYLPNIHFTETGLSTQLRVRGIGSDNSQGFEQSVGMYIDGIYYGRAQLFRSPIMDMSRAELLRGPQTTLFGKNSIAGALNLTTARPTDQFEGKVSLSHEVEQNQNEFNAVVSGPLSETVNARLAVRSYSEDGYFYNSFKDTQEPRTEEDSIRLSVDWQATDKLSVFFKAQHDSFDVDGRAIDITQDIALDGSSNNYAFYLDDILGDPTLESDIPFVRQTESPETSRNEINNFLVNAEYELGENTLTFVTGWLDFNYTDNCDCDYTASEILNVNLSEDYSQFSQEIRITSPTDQKIEWMGGVFYQQWDQNFVEQLDINPGNFLTFTFPQLSDTGIRRNFDQDSTTWSAFAQGTWHINAQWHLTAGARFTQETKDATKVINVIQPSTNEILDDPVAAATYTGVFLAETEQDTGHNLRGDRKETPVTPFINVQYDLNDNVMLYSSFTIGSKAGGFDPRSNTTQFFEFEEEKATAFEIGAKTTVGDGRGEVNVSIFRTDYDDLQISQFDGRVGFNPSNASETRVQGVEIDGRWALTSNLTAAYGMAYLDFEYLDFQNGNCYAGQTPDGIDLDGDDILDTCDYSGKQGVYTPNLTTNISLDYYYNVTSDIAFTVLLDTQYVADQQVHVNLDPTGEIDSYNLVNLRLALESDSWSVALLGKNLLDEYVASYSANAPLSETNFNTNTHYSFIRRPRSVAMEVAYKF